MEKEISLREVLEVLFKQKWIIIIVTVVFVMITTIYNLFITKDIYETYSIVNLQSTQQIEDKNPNNMKLLSESLKSPAQLNALIEKNQLDKNVYSVGSLSKMFRLEASSDNSYIKIFTKGRDPEQLSQIANLLAFELGVLKEVSDRSLIVGAAEKRLNELSGEIEIAKANLSETQKQLKQIDEIQVTKEALSDNELLRSVLQENANTDVKSSANLEMESELINPTYNYLQTKVADASIALNSLISEEAVLKQKVSDNEIRIEEMENKSTKDKLEANRNERITVESNIITIIPSIKPGTAVSQDLIMTNIFAAILGVILSLIFVFLRHQLKGMPRSGVNV